MESLVDIQRNPTIDAHQVLDSPVHDSMSPVRGIRSRSLGSPLGTDASKGALDKVAWVRDERGGLADLGHGGGDEVGEDELGLDVVGGELGAERGGPLLEEGFGAGVGCEEGGGEETAEGAHGEDEAALALHHAGNDEGGDAEGAVAVDVDDVLHFGELGFGEGGGNVVGLADVVDEDGDVEAGDFGGKGGVVGLGVFGKVHGEGAGLDLVFLGDFGREGGQFAGGTGDEEDIVALGGDLKGEFLAESIRGTGNDSPRTLWTKFGELLKEIVRS